MNNKPTHNNPVLAWNGAQWVRAQWVAKHLVEVDFDDFDNEGEYSEEHDARFYPEGWYEISSNGFKQDKAYWYINGVVTAWQELPPAPVETKMSTATTFDTWLNDEFSKGLVDIKVSILPGKGVSSEAVQKELLSAEASIKAGFLDAAPPQPGGKLYTSPQPQQETVATCPQNIIYAITAYGDARADQDANSAPMTSNDRLADCIRLVREALAQPQQEPVAWMHEWPDGERIPLLYPRNNDPSELDPAKSVRPLVYGDT